jgi:MinD superfamily P-loop ATPase
MGAGKLFHHSHASDTGWHMKISRKEFFKKSLTSLGEALVAVGDALTTPADTPLEIRTTDHHPAHPHENRVAVAGNERCLARNSGCFACMERCAPGAIAPVPGVGIKVTQHLCNGCGVCEYVCPVTPKAVRLQDRSILHTSADHTQPTRKGE